VRDRLGNVEEMEKELGPSSSNPSRRRKGPLQVLRSSLVRCKSSDRVADQSLWMCRAEMRHVWYSSNIHAMQPAQIVYSLTSLLIIIQRTKILSLARLNFLGIDDPGPLRSTYVV
jgi:hypothetical protein